MRGEELLVGGIDGGCSEGFVNYFWKRVGLFLWGFYLAGSCFLYFWYFFL